MAHNALTTPHERQGQTASRARRAGRPAGSPIAPRGGHVSTIREALLVALAAGREMEAALVAVCDDAPPARPDAWTVRDHLAHIAHYREHAAAVLDAARTGGPAPADAEAELDERNARILAENRGVSAAEAVERASASYGVLVRAVERLSLIHI